MYCIWCGKIIENESKFCCYCGKKIPPKIDYNKHYISRKYIITLNELNLYTILLEIAKELDLILLCQVSLYNIIETRIKNDLYFNKIRSKSIDFVLVRKIDCKIELCIELDDKTHHYQNRIERDIFINKLFNDLNINLLRIKSQPYYNKKEIKEKIITCIKK